MEESWGKAWRITERMITEIARLRDELKNIQVAGGELEDHINDADDENIRLRADNALLQEQLREWRGHATADELARLRAEVERLTAALTEIAREQSAATALAAADKFQAIARAALAADGKGG